MQRLKPITILGVGSILSGVAFSSVFLAADKNFRSGRGIAISFLCGVVFGLLFLMPIALSERCRIPLRACLAKDRATTGRIAYALTLATGYLIASFRHHIFDWGAFIAMGVVVAGAIFGVILSSADEKA